MAPFWKHKDRGHLAFDLRSQPLCPAQLNGNPSIIVARCQLPTTPCVQHRVSVIDRGSQISGSPRCHVVQFSRGELMFRIVHMLPLSLHDISHEIERLVSITNIRVVAVVLQFIQLTLDEYILFGPNHKDLE